MSFAIRAIFNYEKTVPAMNLLRPLPSLVASLFLIASPEKILSQIPADTGVTVIHAGKMFDSEKAEFVTNRDIVVVKNRITSVGEKLDVPPGAREIDLRGFTVLPGLIDAHTHLLTLEDPSSADPMMENAKAIIREGLPLRTLHAAARARTFLAAGITTVRDLGNSGQFGDVALRDAINDGSVDGPRMIVSGPGLSPEGGQFPGLQKKYSGISDEEYRIVRGAEDGAMAVRENVTYGANVIKVYSNNTPNRTYLSIAEMKAIVEEASKYGMKVTAHATNNLAVWQAAQAGVNSIDHVYNVDDTTLVLLKKRGVAIVPTDVDSFLITRIFESAPPRGQRPTPEQIAAYLAQQRDRLRRAMKAGVTVVAGSDMYLKTPFPQGTAAKRVLFAYHAAGMSTVEILRAATMNSARCIGWENRIGVLKAGGFADIIAVDGDPLADFSSMERVRFVMKNGTVYLGK